ncbi:hypothetical protein C3K47_19215, partial [Solitalea longa]
MKKLCLKEKFNLNLRKTSLLLLITILSLLSNSLKAQTTLAQGDLSFVGFNANAPDGFAFITWVNLAPNTEIRFTDNGFNSTTTSTAAGNYREQEQYVVWTNNTGAIIPAGTKITISINAAATTTFTNIGAITSVTNSSNGTPTVGIALTNTSGDQVFAFQGVGGSSTNSPTATFTGSIIAGLGFSGSTGAATGWASTGTINASTSYLPGNLSGTSQVFLGPNVVGGMYTGPTSGQSSWAAYKALVANPANWTKVPSGTVDFTTIPSTISVGSPPAITGQPSNSAICAGANTTFSISASNATSYKWQVSTNAGGSFSDLSNTAPYSGITTTTLTITGATSAMNGYQYKCIATGSASPDATSNAVTLTVNPAPAITAQPSTSSICAGGNTTFTATASNATGYQWQVDQGAGYSYISNGGVYSGATTATLTITGATAGLNGYVYRVIATGACFPDATSNGAALTINSAPAITAQPSARAICAGDNTTFTATASNATGYQWQVDQGAGFSNISNAAPYSGATTATLTITGATAGLSGYVYRVVARGACTPNATSNTAALTINSAPAITAQPSNSSACLGGSTTFSVTATNATGYQWQVNMGSGFVSVISGGAYTGVSTPTLTIQPSTFLDGAIYRCIVSGACSSATSNSATLTIGSAPAIVSSPANQTVNVGDNTSFSVSATGPTGYQWQVDQGSGFSNVSDGAPYSGSSTATLNITGASGTLNGYSYRCVVSGSCSPVATSNSATLTVTATIAVSPASLSGGTVGSSYSQSITASGGTTPYSYAITAGALPAGLTLNTSTGTLSGTPTAGGSFNFTVSATDASTGPGAPYSGSNAYTLTINAPTIVVSPASSTLSAGEIPYFYSRNITASGGTTPYSYAVTSGALPPGLSLDINNGNLSGNPTTAGNFNFTISATDASTGTGAPYSGSSTYALTINPPTITPGPILSSSFAGNPYSSTISTMGFGTTLPYSYAISAGTLPQGLTLSSGGDLIGTPTEVGSFNFTITATDASTAGRGGPFSGSTAYSLSITPPLLNLSTINITSGQAGLSYNKAFSASGGTTPYSYSITAGALPPGLSMSSDGTLSGTPTAFGYYSFTVKVTDATTGTGAPFSNTMPVGIQINAPAISVSPNTLSACTAGTAYNEAVTASGGTAPYAYAISVGALPTGLTLNTSTGALSGTPTAVGNFNFTVAATDATTGPAAPFYGSRAYSLTVNPPTISFSPTSLSACTVGTVYSETVTASEGTAPYTYAITAGALPAGLTLNTSTGSLTGIATAGGTFNFTVTATDATTGTGAPYLGSRAYTLTVNAPTIAISPSTLLNAEVRALYSETIAASGGTAPYSYEITSGALPAGLIFNPYSGSFSGIPTASGTFNFTVTATDASVGTGPYFGINSYSITVNKGNQAISFATSDTKVYGDADYTPLAVSSNNTIPITYSSSDNSIATIVANEVHVVGAGTVTITANQVGNTDFNAATPVQQTLIITPLAVTVTAEAGQSKVYGSADPAVYTYTSIPVTGSLLANGQSVMFSGSLSREAGENVGSTYAISQGSLANSNYTITYTGADFAITPLDVTVTADANQAKVYGSVDPALTYTSAPAAGTLLANGQSVTFSGALSRTPGENVGSSYSINQGTLANSNYTINYTSSNFAITPLAVTITTDGSPSKVYGSVDPAFTYTSTPAIGSPLANGQSVAFSGALSRTPGENVGSSYAINQGTLVNSNYTINYTGANFAITPLAVTVTADASQSKVYGSVDPAFSFVSAPAAGSTLANGQSISFSGSLSRAPGENVGTSYAINQGTLANSNYTISYTGANFAITP